MANNVLAARLMSWFTEMAGAAEKDLGSGRTKETTAARINQQVGEHETPTRPSVVERND
ncbi:MAG TPA: hypothetical protein VGX03_13600 [Candidatus Binatia bacterium]|jgi:hypothetical protein|nr:hypothetical protein [Candidatus Binatia bacterium]